jgi:hypothetical protein
MVGTEIRGIDQGLTSIGGELRQESGQRRGVRLDEQFAIADYQANVSGCAPSTGLGAASGLLQDGEV